MTKIRELRLKNKISQSQLAKVLNITQQAVSAYEQGIREPDSSTIRTIAEYFDVSTDYLLGKTNTANRSNTENEGRACHSIDISDLPEVAKKQVEEYVELLRLKYNSDRSLKK